MRPASLDALGTPRAWPPRHTDERRWRSLVRRRCSHSPATRVLDISACHEHLLHPKPSHPRGAVESPPAASRPHRSTGSAPQHAPRRAQAGGEGRIRTSEAARATDLQSVAFDRSATSPMLVARLRSTPAFGRRCIPSGTALGYSLSGFQYCRYAASLRLRSAVHGIDLGAPGASLYS